VIVTINFLLKLVNRSMMGQEHHPSREDEQNAMFNKLAISYLINNVLIPLFVFTFPFFAHQGKPAAHPHPPTDPHPHPSSPAPSPSPSPSPSS
jgi:hypothetical protein